MKHILHYILICLVLAIKNPVSAQCSYIPLVEEGKEWICVDGTTQERYWFEGDTTLYGRLCKKMYCKMLYDGIPAQSPDNYIGAFYEDGHRVYFFYQPLREGLTASNEQLDVSVPRLYMDFDAQPGDELEVWTPSNVGRQHRSAISVTSIDTLTRRGRTIRCICFTNKTENDTGMNFYGSNMNFWMEGIGAPTTPICHVYGNSSPYSGATTYFIADVCHIDRDTLYTGANLPAPLIDEETYHHRHFIEEGKRWLTTTYINDSPLTIGSVTYDYRTYTSINTYYFDGDTIIDGNVCHIMMRESVRKANDVTTEYVGAFREADRRVWCYAPNSTEPCLLYDFQAVYGDTVRVGRLSLDTDTAIVLKPNKPLSSNGAFLKSVSLGGYNSRLSWNDGVGSMSAPVNNVSFHRDGASEELRCCWIDADTVCSNLSGFNYVREQVYEGLHVMNRVPDDDYVPFVEPGKSWVTAHFMDNIGQGDDNIKTLSTYRLEGDTTIADTRCLKLMRSILDIASDVVTTEYVAALFEDNRRVMFFPSGMDKSYLMHDFYSSAGDTILSYDCEAAAWRTPNSERAVRPVCSIVIGHSDEMYDGIRQKTCHYYSIKQNHSGIWLKGIGDTQGPTHVAASDSRNVLLHCSLGDRVLYHDTRYDTILDGIKNIEVHDSPHVVNRKCIRCKFYDLSGRRLATPPTRGLYIEEGKVKVKREERKVKREK